MRSTVASRLKNPGLAFLLCILLGGIGAHEYYLGKIGRGLLYTLFFSPACQA